MIRQFLDSCQVLGALALVGLALAAVVSLASLLTRAFGRKP